MITDETDLQDLELVKQYIQERRTYAIIGSEEELQEEFKFVNEMINTWISYRNFLQQHLRRQRCND